MKRCTYCDSVLRDDSSSLICEKCLELLKRMESEGDTYLTGKMPFEEENQKFKINVDGVEQEAELIGVLDFGSERVAVYSVDYGEDKVDIFASYVIEDFDGRVHFENIENPSVKSAVEEYIHTIVEE